MGSPKGLDYGAPASVLAVAAYRHTLPAQRGALHRFDDGVGSLLGNLHDREPVRDLNHTQLPRGNTGLIGDCADEVRWSDAGLPARTDIDARCPDARSVDRLPADRRTLSMAPSPGVRAPRGAPPPTARHGRPVPARRTGARGPVSPRLRRHRRRRIHWPATARPLGRCRDLRQRAARESTCSSARAGARGGPTPSALSRPRSSAWSSTRCCEAADVRAVRRG